MGRTEYTIMMYDSKTPGRKWNISYFDYTSNMATAETQSDYSKYFFLIYGLWYILASLLTAEDYWFKCDLYLQSVGPINLWNKCIDLRLPFRGRQPNFQN